jgi:NADH-quinone oxidoreductase subunit L
MSAAAAAWVCLLSPLASALLLTLLGARISRRASGYVATLATFVSFGAALVALFSLLSRDAEERHTETTAWTWLSAGDFEAGLSLLVDPLSVLMMLIVSGVGALIVGYSIGYMDGDDEERRFFAYMSIFVFSMLLLVESANLVMLLVGWGLVGLASYLLIGYHHERPSAVAAAKKAFIMNAVGDATMALAIFLLFWKTGEVAFSGVFESVGGLSDTVVTLAALGLLGGAVAKSAQIPLQTWLPDAMEGPTPVSALIHAATMVVAGVYMVARMFPLFVLADDIALDVVLTLGMITVFLSATLGLVANDIKRVIAYSTLNSLGLMFVALGSHSVTAAMLYLFVHGFFKALLFLAAGSVIHATEKQELPELGGLATKMPITACVFAIGALSMIGIFPLSGFWAKDEVLHAVDAHRSLALYILTLVSVFITGLYITRLFVRTFLFESRDRHSWDHAHDAEPLMTWPLIPLAILTVISGFVVFDGVGEALGFPGGFGQFVFFEEPEEFDFAWDVAILSAAFGGAGILVGWYLWSNSAEPAQRMGETFQPVYRVLVNRYYIDDAYQWVIDRIVLTLGKVVAWFDRNIVNDTAVDGTAGLGLLTGFEMKFLETGKLPNYALAIVAGVIGLAVLLLVLRL